MTAEDASARVATRARHRPRFIPVQLTTRLSWAVGMILIGSIDMMINLANNIYFANPNLMRCIVIGPPSFILWVFQTVFTAVGTAFYVIETLNTLSILRSGCDDNFIPIHQELLMTLAFEHIPLSAINYFTSRCRCMHATPIQTMLGAVRILFVFVRMVWYAHIEGKKLKQNEKYKINRAYFMVVCVLFSCTMVFPIMIWRESVNFQLDKKDLEYVSLYFINLPDSMDSHYLDNQNIDFISESQGLDVGQPYLVRYLQTVVELGSRGYNVSFDCDINTTRILPLECFHDNPIYGNPTTLQFRFMYSPDAPVCHLGEIRYNYAMVYANRNCVTSEKKLDSDWTLAYYNRTVPERHQGFVHANLSSPWPNTCVPPRPWYDSSIVVC